MPLPGERVDLGAPSAVPSERYRKFADSLLEQAGFELYVPPLTRSPQLGWSWCVWQRATGPTPPSRSPKRRLFASTNLAANFRECLARLHMDKTGFEREIGFGGFEDERYFEPSSPADG